MKNISIIIILFLAACNNPSEKTNDELKKPVIEITKTDGEVLFKASCATCHKPNEKLVGPALQGVTKRWESKELLYDFVRNSQEVIGRNAYAKKLFKEYNQSPMMPYPQLTDEDIQGVLDYCDSYK
jgi:mono/diheme cytochrome c family protein